MRLILAALALATACGPVASPSAPSDAGIPGDVATETWPASVSVAIGESEPRARQVVDVLRLDTMTATIRGPIDAAGTLVVDVGPCSMRVRPQSATANGMVLGGTCALRVAVDGQSTVTIVSGRATSTPAGDAGVGLGLLEVSARLGAVSFGLSFSVIRD